MNEPPAPNDAITLSVNDGGELQLIGPGLTRDRRAGLFFTTLLGGRRTEQGWLVPARRRPIEDLVVQVVRWLQQHGHSATLDGIADEAVRRDVERRRSFARTRDAAQELRAGSSHIDEVEVSAALNRVGWNFTDRTLHPHQLDAVTHGLTAANPANFSVPGAGKTAATLALAAVHLAHGDIDLILVIGPLSCFRPWESETALALPSLTTRRLRGSATERRRRIRELRPGDVALISYASAAADRLSLIELCRSQRVMLVADESHRIKRFQGGQWAPAVTDIAQYARVRVILSGTPMPQSGRDLYTQLNVLWPGGELTSTRQRFRSRVDNDFTGVLHDVLPFVSRTPKSRLGLREPEVNRQEVPLPAEQAEVYRLVTDHLRAAVQAAGPSDADRLAALRRGRPMRLLQAATNPALLRTGTPGQSRASTSSPTLLTRLDDYDPRARPPAKLLAARDLIRQLPAGEKAVLWSTFIGQLDLTAEMLRADGTSVYQVDGRVAAEDLDLPQQPQGENLDVALSREQAIAAFLGHDGTAVLVTNPASCSESISLHMACHNAIYLDRTYDCAQWLQSIDRIHRLGLPENAQIRIHVLQATADGQSTVDALVDASLIGKEAVMRQLLEGAELAPYELSDDPLDAAQGDEGDLRELMRYLLGLEP